MRRPKSSSSDCSSNSIPARAQKVIFEVVQIPGDRLPVETAARVAYVVVQVAAGFDLKQGQYPNRFKVGVHHLGADAVSGAVRLEELVKCGVAEVFFEVHAPVGGFRRRLPERANRDRESVWRIQGTQRSPDECRTRCRWRSTCRWRDGRFVDSNRRVVLAVHRRGRAVTGIAARRAVGVHRLQP